jgi:hypothetical protein
MLCSLRFCLKPGPNKKRPSSPTSLADCERDWGREALYASRGATPVGPAVTAIKAIAAIA